MRRKLEVNGEDPAPQIEVSNCALVLEIFVFCGNRAQLISLQLTWDADAGVSSEPFRVPLAPFRRSACAHTSDRGS